MFHATHAQRAPRGQGQTLPVITKAEEERETLAFAVSLVTRALAPLNRGTTASLGSSVLRTARLAAPTALTLLQLGQCVCAPPEPGPAPTSLPAFAWGS